MKTIQMGQTTALVFVENSDLESVALSTNPQFLSIIERSRSRFTKEGGISPEEMRRRLKIPKA